MFFIQKLRHTDSINYMGMHKFGMGLSAVVVFLSIVLLFTHGLNFGIDFKGGIAIEIKTEQPVAIDALRSQLNSLNIGEINIQEFGEPTELLVRAQQDKIETSEGNAEQQTQEAVGVIKSRLVEFIPQEVEFRRVEVVGPTVGAELIRSGIIAVVVSILGILFYIWRRYRFQFGLGVVAALVHDVMATLGLFALLQIDFNLSTVAAVLTIAGYSVNDTVVVFDRVRETMRKYKKKSLSDILNQSLNETLSRTFMTSFTTLLALLALYFLGGEIIASFSIALIWGIIVGTYSSIFLATPLLLYMNIPRKTGSDD